MDADQFHACAENLLNRLPEQFRRQMEQVVIVIEDAADQSLLMQMQIDSPDELLGLYSGHPLPERDAVASGVLPDMIYLYRLPILKQQRISGQPIERCIEEVLIHEIGHFFGFSDADMARIEAGSEVR